MSVRRNENGKTAKVHSLEEQLLPSLATYVQPLGLTYGATLLPTPQGKEPYKYNDS